VVDALTDEDPSSNLPVPAGLAVYAIGDIHGRSDLLDRLHEAILADAAGRPAVGRRIVYLGDYIDRGPDSRRVLEHLSGGSLADGIERIALCGNHDDTFLRFLRDPAGNAAWLDFGGDATLRSYGLGHLAHLRRPKELARAADAIRAAVPREHVAFLESLPAMLVQGGRVFVHAGIRPGLPLDAQSDADLLWIREPFLAEGPGLPITVIHGHTPGEEPVFGPGRIGIDTGCFATGRLTALKLTETGAALL
jgi:serine/threonine protein phosphatase 1